jgi:GDP-L-fucose synthase
MQKNSKIYIAGHAGMVGSALVRQLKIKGYVNLIYKSRTELNLTHQEQVNSFFEKEKPEYVFVAAAQVGGILANKTYPADFIYSNIAIQTNIIEAARRHKTQKLVFLASSCMYPKHAKQPISETELLTGPLEPTNQPYAVAKIAGTEMCKAYFRQYGSNFITVIPTNLYGPNDTYHPDNSHVIPALIHKFHQAKINNQISIEIWGSGKPKREFMYVDDMANATILIMQKYDSIEPINIGIGEDISIRDLANLIKETVEYTGTITFNTKMPDGTPRKLLDIKKLKQLGFKSQTSLIDGLKKTYQDYLFHYS